MKNILLAFALLLSTLIYGQKNPEKELGVWYAYGGSHKVSEKINLKTQAHFRFFDIASDMQQLMLRFGANYKINEKFSAYLGYGFFNTDATFDADGGDANEHRLVEDLNINYKHSKFSFSHRFRLEQRFFSAETRHWIRYNLGISHPVTEKLTAYVYGEYFYSLTNKINSQNWLGIGGKYAVTKNVKLQLGYHNISTNNGANFNRIIAGFSINTNHFKK